MPDEMSVEEFVAEMRADIERFQRHWSAMRTAFPRHYPHTMLPGDWLARFAIFKNSTHDGVRADA